MVEDKCISDTKLIVNSEGPYIYLIWARMPYHDILYAVFSLYYFAFATYLWLETKGVPGYMFSNVDELYLTYSIADNWTNFGILNSFFLPDHATGLEIAAHPFVYTHNIAFPNHVAYMIRLLGFSEIYQLTFISMFFAYAGYSLAYWFFRRFINPHLGIIVFVLIVLDYQHVLVQSHTFYRTFQWILLFLVPLTFLEWQNRLRNIEHEKYYKLVFGISLALTMAFEHLIALQSFFIIFFLYLYINPNPFQGRQLFSVLKVVLVSFSIPLVYTMAVQIIYFHDPVFVLLDHLYSYTNRILGWPNPETIRSLYESRGIENYASGTESASEVLRNMKSIFVLSFKEYGLIPFIGATYLLISFILLMFKKLGAVIYKKIPILSLIFNLGMNKEVMILNCFLFAIILLSCLVPQYTYANFVMAHVPLLEIYFIMFAAFVLYFVLSFVLPLFKSRTWHLFIIIALIGIGIKGVASNYFLNPPIPMPAFDVLPKYKGHSFSINYHPQYPAIFTKQWAVNSALPTSFVDDGHLMFKDAAVNKKKYLKPEYHLDIYMKSQGFHHEQMKSKNAELVEYDWNYEIWKLNW